MTFALDRDLLALEPSLFKEVAWTAQKLIDATGVSISGTTLTGGSSDFAAAGVTAGHVALVNGSPLEVVTRLSATTLTVSKLREEPSSPVIPPAAAAGATLVITTFGPQTRIVHEQVLRSVGIEPGVTPVDGVGESSIVNPRALARLEALGALHLILSGAAALVGEDSALWVKAGAYRDRFAQERRAAGAALDLDNDGVADAIRRVSALRFVRG